MIFLSRFLLPKCQLSYPCRNFTLEFPFTDSRAPQCGLYVVHGCNDTTHDHPIVDIGYKKSHYSILGKPTTNQFLIQDAELQMAADSGACYSFANTPPPSSPSVSFAFASPNITVFPCFNKSANQNIRRHFGAYNRTDCEISTVYNETQAARAPPTVRWDASFPCAVSHVPIKPELSSGDLFDMVAPDYILEWRVAPACYDCRFRRGGLCVTVNWNEFYCQTGTKEMNLDSFLFSFFVLNITEFGSCIMKSCKTQF